jgi:hypothetical protein
MKCERLLALVALFAATAAHAADVRVASGAVLYESGLAAPVIDFRSVAENGSVWRGSVNGWTLGIAYERSVERGRRLVFAASATPYDAHSSRRVYRDGVRARELAFGDAAIDVRGGMRVRAGEHATFEPALVIGAERLDAAAPAALRDRWRTPYAGIAFTQRLRFVTADDPFRARIDGVEVTTTAEAYGGRRTWTKLMLGEAAGAPLGRLHFRQSLAAFTGTGLDPVNAFLVGGSWDALGPTAVYGRRYAEFRATRGIIASAGADIPLTRALDAGIRASAFRGRDQRASGVVLQFTGRVAGARVTAAAGTSGGRRIVTASIAGAMFR